MPFFKGKDGKCVIVGRVCPENGDASVGDYCPCWIEAEERDGPMAPIRIRKDCSHRIVHDWVANTNHAAWTTAQKTSEIPAAINQGFESLIENVVEKIVQREAVSRVLLEPPRSGS